MIARRDFMKKGVALVTLGAGGAAVPAVFKGAFAVRASDAAAGAGTPGRILVIVQCAGGNDGLNALVPYQDPAYRKARPALAVPETDVIPLNGGWGLSKNLGALKPLWDAKKLGIVHAAGYPNPDYSHFKSMRIWQTADTAGSFGDGWLGKYLARLEAEEHDPLRGFNVGASLPQALTSSVAPPPSVLDPQRYAITGLGPGAEAQRRQTALLKLYELFPKDTPYAALLETTAQDAIASSAIVQQAAQSPSRVEYPQTSLGQGLKLLGQVIASGQNLRVAHVTLGGFDTHAGQLGAQPALLQTLGDALAAFYADMQALGREQDVFVMTWSEFGRRVEENASGGTDHGAAGPMFLLGGRLRGGFYGEPPSLTGLTDGNLKYTVDFRRVYATVVEQWVGAPSREILGAEYQQFTGMIA